MVHQAVQVGISLLSLINVLRFFQGQQGQVERVNCTVKKLTTSGVLTILEEGAAAGATFEELCSAGSSWVSCMETKVSVYNNTPKYLTGYTPTEVHFPEVRLFNYITLYELTFMFILII